MTFKTKVGNLVDSLEATLSDTVGPVDLTSATVKFSMRLPGSASAKVSLAAVANLDLGISTRGKVRYDWAAGDVDTAGEYWGEFTVTFPSGKKATFPSGREYIGIVIGAVLA